MKLRKTVCLIMVGLLVLLLPACSAKEKDPLAPSNDQLTNTAWVSTGDGSYMTFTGDNDFNWYMEKENTDDNYFRGTYDFYIGEAAMNHLTVDLEEFDVTADEMQMVFDNSENYALENFVCMTVHNTSFMLDGEEQLTEPKDTHYFGFLLNDGTYLDIANMITGTYYGFEKE